MPFCVAAPLLADRAAPAVQSNILAAKQNRFQIRSLCLTPSHFLMLKIAQESRSKRSSGIGAPGMRDEANLLDPVIIENKPHSSLRLLCCALRNAERSIVGWRLIHLRISVRMAEAVKSRPQTSKPASHSESRHDRPSNQCAMDSADGTAP
jgi:hypothetical protein